MIMSQELQLICEPHPLPYLSDLAPHSTQTPKLYTSGDNTFSLTDIIATGFCHVPACCFMIGKHHTRRSVFHVGYYRFWEWNYMGMHMIHFCH
jgi:hypothetical protein